MASYSGKNLHISIFGQSHGKAIGVVVDGLPAGEAIDLEELDAFLERRRTGRNALSTARKEADRPEFLSGLEEGRTCGFPLCAVIRNGDPHSSDYAVLKDHPRPGHADYTAWVRWAGFADMRGGGHFSGRLTAPLCVAGGIALQILARRGIFIGAHLAAVAGEQDDPFPLHPDPELFRTVAARPFPVLNEAAGARMQERILEARQEGDSVGGIIECAAIGLPAGLGSPMFEGVENRLAAVLFGIPAVKGVEFGAGFAAAAMRGSENNDPFALEDGRIVTSRNCAGGILGGITTGMPVTFRVAVKPTPSISRTQQTVSLSEGRETTLNVTGRHDPCIAHRAVPVVEAAAALAVLDLVLDPPAVGAERKTGGDICESE